MDKEIIIKPSFDVNSNMKAVFYILYKPRYLFLFFVFFIIITFNALDSLFNFFNNYKESTEKELPLGLFLILIPISLIYSIYRNTKKQIIENPRLKEDIFFIINNEFFQEKGESFEVKHFWKNLYQIVEKKEMFLIYTKKNRALLIKKADLKDNQYNELKELFNSLHIIKKGLK